jgi:hypothetical protein
MPYTYLRQGDGAHRKGIRQMAQQPNRHVICYTATDVSPKQTYFGRTWEGQDAPELAFHGTLAEAETALAARIAADTAPVATGMFRTIQKSNHRLHSWFEDEAPIEAQFNVDPLGRILRSNGGRW